MADTQVGDHLPDDLFGLIAQVAALPCQQDDAMVAAGGQHGGGQGRLMGERPGGGWILVDPVGG